MTYQYIIITATACINLFLAGYVLYRNPRNILHRSFFIFAAGTAMWSGGVALLFSTKVFAFDKLVLSGGMIMIAGLFLLAKTFPNAQKLERKFWVALIPIGIILALVPFNIFITGMIIHENGNLEPINGPGILLLVIVVGAYIIRSIFLFIKKYKTLTGISKYQLQYLFLGVSLFITAMFFFNVLLPAWGIFRFNSIGPLSSVIFIGFTAYAIVRHQLMDIRVVIQGGLIYSVLLTLIVGFYLGTIFILGYAFQRTTHTTAIASSIFTTIIGIFGVPYIEKRFRRMTDRFFFKDAYSYSDALQTLSEILNSTLDLEEVLRKTSYALRDIFKTDRAYYMLFRQQLAYGPSERLMYVNAFSHNLTQELRRYADIFLADDIPRMIEAAWATSARIRALKELAGLCKLHSIEVVVPIVIANAAEGVLGIGRKRSGDPYTTTDIQLLKTFSYQAAVAIEKAELYKRVADHSRELESRVKERTAQLEKLQDEQRRALTDIAHGLQTPLTITRTKLDLLPQQSAENQDIKVFKESLEGLSGFVHQLLDLAQLGAAAVDFSVHVVDLSKVVEESTEYFAALAEDRNIVLTPSIESHIRVRGHKEKLKELLANLASNAMKYINPDGPRRIYISLTAHQARAELRVSDSGIGIHADDIPHIFEPFYRAKHEARGLPKGSGLGLAIAKKIVEKHGGSIEAESAYGKGTTIIVRIPLYEPSDTAKR